MYYVSMSFAERKRAQSWLRRQFSRQQMSPEYDGSVAGEYPMAVAAAAAAFAVSSLEETRIRDEKRGHQGKDISLTNVKKKEDDKPRGQEPRARSISFSGETFCSIFIYRLEMKMNQYYLSTLAILLLNDL